MEGTQDPDSLRRRELLLHALGQGYSLADPRTPDLEWVVEGNGACLEATPVVWEGSIYLGSRDGFMRAYR